MHNKTFIVDNQAAIVGGRNIGNEYFEADPDLAFGDLDALAIGPVVQELSRVFDLYWNSELVYPATVLKGDPPTDQEIAQAKEGLENFVAAQIRSEYVQALRHSDLAKTIANQELKFEWGEAQVVFDQPEKILHDFQDTQYHLAPMLAPYLKDLKVVMTVPEIGREMGEWFDRNIAPLAYRLELKKDADGSEQLLWHGLEKGKAVVCTHEPEVGFWTRFWMGFMSLWPIESQL